MALKLEISVILTDGNPIFFDAYNVFRSDHGKLVSLMKAHPQWKITKLRLEISTNFEIYGSHEAVEDFLRILNDLDNYFRAHLKMVVLELNIQDAFEPSRREDESYLDLVIQVSQKLASFNNKVEFSVDCGNIRLVKIILKELAKTVHVADTTFYFDCSFDLLEVLQPLVFLKSIKGDFCSLMQIGALRHMQFLCYLSINTLMIPQKKVSFALPNLKVLRLRNQEDTSENFGEFIARLFPNLFSVIVHSKKLSQKPQNLGLDKLPRSCQSIELDFQVLSNCVNLNRNQFPYLSIRICESPELTDISVIDEISLVDLKAVRIASSGKMKKKNYSKYLKIIAQMIEKQQQLQVVDLLLKGSVSMSSKESEEFECEVVHWLNDNESLFASRNIKVIIFDFDILYMSQRFSFETVYLLERLKETWGWPIYSTGLLLTDCDIFSMYSEMKSKKRCDFCNGDLL